jgi:hypothetical protein
MYQFSHQLPERGSRSAPAALLPRIGTCVPDGKRVMIPEVFLELNLSSTHNGSVELCCLTLS